MQTTLQRPQAVSQQPFTASYSETIYKDSAWTRFILWCKNQDEFRFMWLAVMLFSHGCLLTPLTLYVIIGTGNSMLAWAFAIAAMAMTLVTNLAALSTKITIPTYLLSLAIDLGIIVVCLASFI